MRICCDVIRRSRGWLAALLFMLPVFGAATIKTQLASGASAVHDAVADYLDQIADRVTQQPSYAQFVAATAAKKDKRAARLRVLVKITVTLGGKLDYVEIERSSGDPAVDQSALELVRQAQPFGELPPVLLDRGWLVFILPLPLPNSSSGENYQPTTRR